MSTPDLENGFFVRLSPRDKKALAAWGVDETRSMTAQATEVLKREIEKYRRLLGG